MHEHLPSIDKSSMMIHTLSRLLRAGIAWLNVWLTSRPRNSQVYLYFPSSNNVSNISPCNFQAPVEGSRVRFSALEPKFTVGFNISAFTPLHQTSYVILVPLIKLQRLDWFPFFPGITCPARSSGYHPTNPWHVFQPPSIVARLFFGLGGIHTDSHGAQGNLCCGRHCWPFRPSFQACFTYRPTPICLDDRAKPASKGWLFLTDFEPTPEATFWTFCRAKRTNQRVKASVLGYTAIFLDGRRKTPHFRSWSTRPNAGTAAIRQFRTRGAFDRRNRCLSSKKLQSLE